MLDDDQQKSWLAGWWVPFPHQEDHLQRHKVSKCQSLVVPAVIESLDEKSLAAGDRDLDIVIAKKKTKVFCCCNICLSTFDHLGTIFRILSDRVRRENFVSYLKSALRRGRRGS